MSSIDSNIRYTKMRKKLVDDYYALIDNAEVKDDDDFYSIDQNIIDGLIKLGYKAEIISSREIAENVELPFVGILPEGDEYSWFKCDDEETRNNDLMGYVDTYANPDNGNIIAVHY